MLRKEVRHKVITCVVSFAEAKPKFLTVRDRRHGEWIFVTGGCKKKEIPNPIVAALRELEEETRGAVNLKNGVYSYYNFVCNNRTSKEILKDRKNGLDVTIIYHVYIIELNITKQEQQKYLDDFNRHMKLPVSRRCYDENDMMSFDTLEEFNRRNQWKFIVDNVVKNPKFINGLTSSNRHTFSIR